MSQGGQDTAEEVQLISHSLICKTDVMPIWVDILIFFKIPHFFEKPIRIIGQKGKYLPQNELMKNPNTNKR